MHDATVSELVRDAARRLAAAARISEQQAVDECQAFYVGVDATMPESHEVPCEA